MFSTSHHIKSFQRFVIMDPFKISLVVRYDFRPIKYDIAPYKQVMDRWPRDQQGLLRNGKLEFEDHVFGLESFMFDSLGCGPYTGLVDGHVVRWIGKDIGWETFALVASNW
ncbi:hypothetical protein GH714_011122 [Hevea brasiliensis]|uniref:Uncharacterized protein n=1 Tax=Hevea brasiliensis TaxID=3981 RepID=A0A6A6LFN3_HEVBR|nr:hypothetical protein GH714_011122 [Hevea brasiliensis]